MKTILVIKEEIWFSFKLVFIFKDEKTTLKKKKKIGNHRNIKLAKGLKWETQEITEREARENISLFIDYLPISSIFYNKVILTRIGNIVL